MSKRAFSSIKVSGDCANNYQRKNWENYNLSFKLCMFLHLLFNFFFTLPPELHNFYALPHQKLSSCCPVEYSLGIYQKTRQLSKVGSCRATKNDKI